MTNTNGMHDLVMAFSQHHVRLQHQQRQVSLCPDWRLASQKDRCYGFSCGDIVGTLAFQDSLIVKAGLTKKVGDLGAMPEKLVDAVITSALAPFGQWLRQTQPEQPPFQWQGQMLYSGHYPCLHLQWEEGGEQAGSFTLSFTGEPDHNAHMVALLLDYIVQQQAREEPAVFDPPGLSLLCGRVEGSTEALAKLAADDLLILTTNYFENGRLMLLVDQQPQAAVGAMEADHLVFRSRPSATDEHDAVPPTDPNDSQLHVYAKPFKLEWFHWCQITDGCQLYLEPICRRLW